MVESLGMFFPSGGKMITFDLEGRGREKMAEELSLPLLSAFPSLLSLSLSVSLHLGKRDLTAARLALCAVGPCCKGAKFCARAQARWFREQREALGGGHGGGLGHRGASVGFKPHTV